MKLIEIKPIRGRVNIILEEARIQHLEDFVIFEGSRGAKQALEALYNINKNMKNITIKWDGAVGVVFGRDPNGEFIFTDKSGFVAKGYDGRSTSPEDLEAMIMARAKDPKKLDSYKQFAAKMKNIYPVLQAAVPEDLEGYYQADILYFQTPQLIQDRYVFKPNVVTYSVAKDSDLGKRIGRSQVGVVVHRLFNEQGATQAMPDKIEIKGNDLLILPPVTVSKAVELDTTVLDTIKSQINTQALAVDTLLDQNKLSAMKVTDFSNILYTYVNSKVITGMKNVGQDFAKWLSNSAVSRNKQAKILEYIKQYAAGFTALWNIWNALQAAKNNVIGQLDSQAADVTATTGDQPGGEGYVIQTAQGAIKLVNRAGFTRANFLLNR